MTEPHRVQTAEGSTEPAAPLLRTLALARPSAGRLAWASVLGAGAAAASIGLLGTAAWLISRASEHPSEAVLGIAIVVVQVCGLSRGLLRYRERLVGHDAAFRALADLRVRVYDHLEPLAPAGLAAFRRGDLLARLVRDVDAQQDLLLRVVPPFAVAATVGAATVGFVWWLLPAAGMVLALCLLLSATVVPWATGWLARRAEGRRASAQGELSVSVIDLIEGAHDLIAYGATADQLTHISEADADLTRVAQRSGSTAGVGVALTTLFAGLAMWGGLLVGVAAVHSGDLNGVWLAVIALIPLAAFELVGPLPIAAQALERARRSAYRLFSVFDTDPPIAPPDDPLPVPADHTVTLAGVAARYPGAAMTALNGIDLTVAVGTRLAVVGPSGSGKTTLAMVLLGFLPYEAGTARLGPVDLDRIRGDDLRRTVGLVDQDAHLFDTTIAKNLRIGRQDATEDDLRQAMTRVGLSTWLDRLPDGLETEVGTNGSRLSGGQRRRLAVARALLGDFDVLVLDEPTEHLDPEAADRLMADLLGAAGTGTLVVVTHRFEGLDRFDQVAVVEGGRVVACGESDKIATRLRTQDRVRRRRRRRPEDRSTDEEGVDLCPVVA